MPITKGAKKAHRASLRKRVFNIRRKNTMNSILKKMQKLIVGGGSAEAEKMLPEAYKAIDKSVKRGILKKNTAARKKSRLVGAILRSR